MSGLTHVDTVVGVYCGCGLNFALAKVSIYYAQHPHWQNPRIAPAREVELGKFVVEKILCLKPTNYLYQQCNCVCFCCLSIALGV